MMGQLNFYNKIKLKAYNNIREAAKACIGDEHLRRFQRTYFRLLHPADYKLARKQFDILFYWDLPQRWQNIELVVKELRNRRSDLRLGLAFRGSMDDFLPNSFDLKRISAISHVTIGALYLFDTQIIYTTTSILPRMASHKANVVHAVMTMLSFDNVLIVDDFDAYDYIFCGGIHQLEVFRKLAFRHPALLGKRLVSAGYPKLDLMLASYSTKRRPTDRSVRSTVVYAPTHHVALRSHGEAVITSLLAEGHRVIFRPHIYSFDTESERDVIGLICQLHADNPNFSLDTSTDYTESFSLADLMVTDMSGTGFNIQFQL